jgi:hypothetical protein
LSCSSASGTNLEIENWTAAHNFGPVFKGATPESDLDMTSKPFSAIISFSKILFMNAPIH